MRQVAEVQRLPVRYPVLRLSFGVQQRTHVVHELDLLELNGAAENNARQHKPR
jgi:hypothetical protein